MDWFNMFKRYVWDDEKTPYLVPVSQLSQKQARHELFIYSLFMCILFAVVALVALTDGAPHGRSPGVSLYSFTIAVSAAILGATKFYHAAVYCGTAPLGLLVYLYLFGFHSDHGWIDKLFLVALALVWLRYSYRVISIVNAFPDMKD